MSRLEIRKTILTVEEVFHDGGPMPETPLMRGACFAVIKNIFAENYEPEIQGFMEDLKPLGIDLATRLTVALGGASKIEGYGKASLVGSGGELEHGALWHAPGGYAMREVIGGTKAIVPSTKKVGGMGARIDVPITHINASYVRSHFDAMEIGINDAPRADEMLVALVMTTGARIHNRAGGLAAGDIKGEDGLR